MRYRRHSTLALAMCAAVLLSLTACSRGIEVRTMADPDAGFSRLHTFRMLPGPTRRDARPVRADDDPMISNSIANRTIRANIVAGLVARGYVRNERSADFDVAFYASAREKLDVTEWDYGYPYNPRWGRIGVRAPLITQYTEGSVVVDLINPRNHELLWRGEGRAVLTDNLNENVRRLADVAQAIVEKIPEATRQALAARL